MSWVEITNGKDTFKVPYQAFKDIEERNGFVLVNPIQKPIEKPKAQKDVDKVEVKEKVNDDTRTVSNRAVKK